jgi:hypothetical protein
MLISQSILRLWSDSDPEANVEIALSKHHDKFHSFITHILPYYSVLQKVDN